MKGWKKIWWEMALRKGKIGFSVLLVFGWIFSAEGGGQGKNKELFSLKPSKSQLLPQSGAQQKVKIKLFFPRDGDQNPSSDPNWYYYWSQTTASSGNHRYNSSLNTDGEYLPGDTYFKIGPSARLQDKGYYDKGGEGIDNFGSTCLHEKKHMDYFLQTWGSWQNYLTRKPTDDKDEDCLKDSDEPALGYDPTRKGTPTNQYCNKDDFEDLACRAESQWKNSSADAEDWASPGHQF